MILKNSEKKEQNSAVFTVASDAAEFEKAVNAAYLKNKKNKNDTKTEQVVQAEPEKPTPVVEPEPEPEPQKEEVPQSKEDEVIVIEEAEKVVPLPPPVEEKKPADITYKIKWGDTLWDIADTYYKNPWRYHKIAKYNNIKKNTACCCRLHRYQSCNWT